LAANIARDLPGAPPLVAGVIGPWIRGTGTDNVRFGTMDAWRDNPTVLAGPQAYDIRITDDEYYDDKHFAANDELQTLGYRWWKSLAGHFYGGVEGRGPVATGAVVAAAGTSIDVTFSASAGLSSAPAELSPSAWTVTDGGDEVSVGSATVISPTTVRLQPQTALSAAQTIAVSFALQNDAEGAIVPRHVSTGNVGLGPSELPADPFVRGGWVGFVGVGSCGGGQCDWWWVCDV